MFCKPRQWGETEESRRGLGHFGEPLALRDELGQGPDSHFINKNPADGEMEFSNSPIFVK